LRVERSAHVGRERGSLSHGCVHYDTET
jgi:hypothetical protein